MQEYKICELLVIASIDPNDSECSRAFGEIHSRYKDYIWNLSYKSARSIDSINSKKVGEAIAHNTFITIFTKADKFEARTDNSDNDFKAWVSGLVRNVTLQYLDENNKNKKHLVFMEALPDIEERVSDDATILPISIERSKLDNALKTLSDKERSILLAWYNFYTDGKVRDVDKGVKEALAKQFNVKVDSLKQIKKRAFKKLMIEIEKNKTA